MIRKCLTVKYENSKGELVSVILTPGFRRENVILRADVLRSLKEEITRIYNRTVVELEKRYSKSTPPGPIRTLTLIKPDGTIEVRDRNVAIITLQELQEAVGGYIQQVPHWPKYKGRKAIVYANETGRLDGLPLNETAMKLWQDQNAGQPGDYSLYGTIAIDQIKHSTGDS